MNRRVRLSWDDEDVSQATSIQVHEDPDKDLPVDTGVLDANGEPILRWPERVTFGFPR